MTAFRKRMRLGERVLTAAAAYPLLVGEGQGERKRRLFGALSLAMAAVLVFAAFAAAEARAENVDLTVDVSGLRNYKGRVVLMLWADSEHDSSFPDPSRVQFRDERPGDPPCDFTQASLCRRTIESLQNLTVSYTFRDIPQGDYAAFVFHDENNNGILDTGLFHRPLEGRGYSQILPQDLNPIAARIVFHRARFALPVTKTIVIGLRYPPKW
jgi:uncharacterized protein (DUF2141 family)